MFLKPKLELTNKFLSAEKVLNQHAFNLTQNRLSFVQLTRLNPKSASFDFEKSDLVGTLQKTIKEGLEAFEAKRETPSIDPKLSERFPALLEETKEIYKRQDGLLKRVFETKSYGEGVAIMKSSEAIELLTKQTNLILEYQFWLDEINRRQESPTLQ